MIKYLTYFKNTLRLAKKISLIALFLITLFCGLPSYATVYTFPEEDRRAPFLTAIHSAQKSIRIAAYRFDDQAIAKALRAAADRGVKITLLKEGNIWRYPTEGLVPNPQDDTCPELKHPNIRISGTPSCFNQTHSKAVIIDNRQAIISTANFFDMGSQFDRDFAIDILDPLALKDLTQVFDADACDERIVAPVPGSIVWGPDHQRSTLLKMINGAQKIIRIYQQDLQDINIARTLVAAARKKVDVRILMMETPFGEKHGNKNLPNQTLLVKAGAKVMFIDTRYRNIHAKVMIADDEMYMGSCNFYTPSIDETRELGVLTKNPHDIGKVLDTFEADWKQATPLRVPADA